MLNTRITYASLKALHDKKVNLLSWEGCVIFFVIYTNSPLTKCSLSANVEFKEITNPYSVIQECRKYAREHSLSGIHTFFRHLGLLS